MTTEEDAYTRADKASLITEEQRQAYTAVRDRIRAEYLFSREQRPPTTGRGVHHVALISKDVETTVEWYQNVAGFPVTVLFENRDLAGSTHFFFDVGNGNCLAFFDLRDSMSARAYYGAALDSSREAHDPHLAAATLGHMSFIPAPAEASMPPPTS